MHREVDDETIIFWEPVTYGYYVDAAPNLILDSVLDLFLKSHNFTEFLPILEQVIVIRAQQSNLKAGWFPLMII